MTPEQTKAWIWSRCTEDGDCMRWEGATDDCGTPQVRRPGSRKVEAARRVLLEAMGKKLDGLLATTTCDDPLCLAEEHCVAWTRKQLQKRNGAKLVGNVARNAKLSAAARARATLDLEAVRQMRASNMTTRQAAAAYGVAQSTACDAMAHLTWKDYSSPFAGLIR